MLKSVFHSFQHLWICKKNDMTLSWKVFFRGSCTSGPCISDGRSQCTIWPHKHNPAHDNAHNTSVLSSKPSPLGGRGHWHAQRLSAQTAAGRYDDSLLLRRSFSRASRRDGDHPDAAPPERQRGALHLHQRSLEALPQEGGVYAHKQSRVNANVCLSKAIQLSFPLRYFIPRTASTTL